MARNLSFFERNLRRSRLYGGRICRTCVLPAPRHPCLFLHMPKCGGTSISEAMYATIPLGRGVAVIDAISTRRAAAIHAFGIDDQLLCHEDRQHGQMVFDLREKILLQQMAWGSQLIHGHVLYSTKADAHFGNSFKYVTILRNPVERMISNYRMAAKAGVVTETFDKYLETPIARSHAQVYLRYLSGQNVVSNNEIPENLELAKSRLKNFAVIGFLENLVHLQHCYRQVFGVSLRIRAYNQSDGEKPSLSQSQIKTIQTLTEPDQKLFEFAKGLS